MRMKGFVLGAVFGLVGGVAGCVKLNKKFSYPVNWWRIKRNVLNDLVKKVLGSEYFIDWDTDWLRPYTDYARYAGNADERSKAREELKNCVEKQKDEEDDGVYRVVDILGVEGIFDDGHTILGKLFEWCNEFHRGVFGDGDDCTADEYDIHGETFYVYYLRGEDNPEYALTVEKRPVTTNYYGTFVTKSKLDISGNVAVLDDEALGFTGEWMTVDGFLLDEQWKQR